MVEFRLRTPSIRRRKHPLYPLETSARTSKSPRAGASPPRTNLTTPPYLVCVWRLAWGCCGGRGTVADESVRAYMHCAMPSACPSVRMSWQLVAKVGSPMALHSAADSTLQSAPASGSIAWQQALALSHIEQLAAVEVEVLATVPVEQAEVPDSASKSRKSWHADAYVGSFRLLHSAAEKRVQVPPSGSTAWQHAPAWSHTEQLAPASPVETPVVGDVELFVAEGEAVVPEVDVLAVDEERPAIAVVEFRSRPPS